MLPDDVAVALGMSVSTARRWLREGRLGPTIRLGRRRAILRDTLLRHLEDLEEHSGRGLAVVRDGEARP